MGHSRHCTLPATLDLRMAHRGRHLDRSGSKIVFERNLRPAAKMRNDLRGGYASEPAAFLGRSPGRQTKQDAGRIKIARAGRINNRSCPRRGYGNDASARDDDRAQRPAGDSGKPDLGSNEGDGVIPYFGLKQDLQLRLVGKKDIDTILNKIEKRPPMPVDAKAI